MTEKLTSDYTAGVLKGIPVFCINRLYKTFDCGMLLAESYRFEFENGFGASVVKFKDPVFSSGQDYELAVIGSNGELTYETPITSDVCRGDEYEMHRLLIQVELLLKPQALIVSRIINNSDN